MSQIFDFFVCTRPIIKKWAEAMGNEDEERQSKLESKMPGFVSFKNLGQDEFNLLAQCVAGGEADFLGELELVDAVTDEEGPWLMAFSQSAVEAIAGMTVGQPLLDRWAQAAAELQGRDEADCREILTAEAAQQLKELCMAAVEQKLGVFSCFYG